MASPFLLSSPLTTFPKSSAEQPRSESPPSLCHSGPRVLARRPVAERTQRHEGPCMWEVGGAQLSWGHAAGALRPVWKDSTQRASACLIVRLLLITEAPAPPQTLPPGAALSQASWPRVTHGPKRRLRVSAAPALKMPFWAQCWNCSAALLHTLGGGPHDSRGGTRAAPAPAGWRRLRPHEGGWRKAKQPPELGHAHSVQPDGPSRNLLRLCGLVWFFSGVRNLSQDCVCSTWVERGSLGRSHGLVPSRSRF